jgi:hypothetical protein
MARATLTKTTLLGPYPALQPTANSLDLTLAAANVSDKNQFKASGDDLLIVQNSDAGSAYTFTLTSTTDDKNRTGDITAYSLAAGEIAVFRVKNEGWRQSDGYIYLEGSNAAIKFAVIAL